LRGCEKLTKRQKTGALTYNLSVLLRHLFGVGTLKQALALGKRALLHAVLRWFGWIVALFAPRPAFATSRTEFCQSPDCTTALHA
jgi:hypothetical protein